MALTTDAEVIELLEQEGTLSQPEIVEAFANRYSSMTSARSALSQRLNKLEKRGVLRKESMTPPGRGGIDMNVWTLAE